MDKLEKFKEGYKNFKSIKFKENEQRFKKLVKEGQKPTALFIGCSDSRVMPNLITGSGVGELFIVRNIGNFVPPFSPDNDFHSTAAAIEYATSHLKVSDIIVCGHSDCGAIKELFNSHKITKENVHTIKWLELGKEAREKALEVVGDKPFSIQREFTEKLSVVMQLENLLTYPAVKSRVESGELFLHAWHYRIDTGEISFFDEEEAEFKPLEES